MMPDVLCRAARVASQRRTVAAALVLSICVCTPARAQDQGLDPLLLANRSDIADTGDLDAQTIQLYRLPLAFHLRSLEDHAWGLRVTFPVSLSSLRLDGVSNLGEFVKKLGLAAVVPGVEVELPIGTRTLVRPFGEVGIGKSSDSSAEMFYGAGVRARTFRDLKKLHFTYGGQIAGRKTPGLAGTYDKYASFEGGVDTQVPLGFSLGSREARGGIYVIGRAFDGLELRRDGRPPIVARSQLEAGVSFSTAPELRIWKIPLPWLAAGYHSGPISGVRIYAIFPF